MYLHSPLLAPFFRTRWLPFRMTSSANSPPSALSPLKLVGGVVGPLCSSETELDYDSFAMELDACDSSGFTDEKLVVFTAPQKMLPTTVSASGVSHYYGLCSADPIALTILPGGLSVGDTCGVVDGSMSEEGTGFVFLGYTGTGLGLVRRSSSGAELVELCAQETATRNTPYTALLGTWDPSESKYCYDDAPTVMAVDHRYGMPLAETGSKGLYQAMSSSVEGHDGTLYVCVSLDCEAPPEGCNECEGA